VTRVIRQIAASIAKEARTLARDRGGLLVLFGMPTVLVLVVTVVQERAMRFVAAPNADLLIVDEDGGDLGPTLQAGLESAGVFTVATVLDGVPPTEETAREAVSHGRFQGVLVLRKGTSAAARENARHLAERLLADPAAGPPSAIPVAPPARLSVWLDPVLTAPYVKLVRNVSAGVMQGAEIRLLVEAFTTEMVNRASARLGRPLPDAAMAGLANAPMAVGPGTLLALDAAPSSEKAWTDIPDSVQQNVPAWTIFSMFLIVIPLSGALIRERRDGTSARLRIIPGAPAAAMLGKAVLYVGVCAAQFLLMIAIGAFVLPLLGTPAFAPGGHLGAALVVGLATAMAAMGFGLAVGAIAGTPEQASIFGSTTIVILGAIGGVMMPRFSMPQAMRELAVVSPLGWAQEAFLGLFLRGGDLASVAAEVLRLLAFALVGMAVALTFQRRQG
jgi:ABC-2 type transport system permease protein